MDLPKAGDCEPQGARSLGAGSVSALQVRVHDPVVPGNPLSFVGLLLSQCNWESPHTLVHIGYAAYLALPFREQLVRSSSHVSAAARFQHLFSHAYHACGRH